MHGEVKTGYLYGKFIFNPAMFQQSLLSNRVITDTSVLKVTYSVE